MVNATILMRLLKDSAGNRILESVKKIQGVKDAYYVFGRYDIVAYARTEDYPALARLALKLNALKGVRSTETLIEG